MTGEGSDLGQGPGLVGRRLHRDPALNLLLQNPLTEQRGYQFIGQLVRFVSQVQYIMALARANSKEKPNASL
jgi:hypothetical protein